MLELKKEFSNRELKWFGVWFGMFGGMMVWLLAGQFNLQWLATGVAVFSILAILVYYTVPAFRNPIYRGWLATVWPIGWLVSIILLASVFFFLITPIGWLRRAFRQNPMKQNLDQSASTYWTPRKNSNEAERYFKQY